MFEWNKSCIITYCYTSRYPAGTAKINLMVLHSCCTAQWGQNVFFFVFVITYAPQSAMWREWIKRYLLFIIYIVLSLHRHKLHAFYLQFSWFLKILDHSYWVYEVSLCSYFTSDITFTNKYISVFAFNQMVEMQGCFCCWCDLSDVLKAINESLGCSFRNIFYQLFVCLWTGKLVYQHIKPQRK